MFSRRAAMLIALVLSLGCIASNVSSTSYESGETQSEDLLSGVKLIVHEEYPNGEIHWGYDGKACIAKDLEAFSEGLREAFKLEKFSAIVVAIPKRDAPGTECVEITRSFAEQHNIPFEFEFHSSQLLQRE